MSVTRRTLLAGLAASTAVAGFPLPSRAATGPRNVILVRFGGGARRRETLDPVHASSPFLATTLAARGTLFPSMEIAQLDAVQTSHAQGTLNLVTGTYDGYGDTSDRVFGERFVPHVPTLFERLRAQLGVPRHQALVVNNENRPQDEFLHHSDAGFDHRPGVLSHHRYATWQLERQLMAARRAGEAEHGLISALSELRAHDYRVRRDTQHDRALDAFWQRWHESWREVAPRGDRGQTELAMAALRSLRPRLLQINYSDCDYVHWGDRSTYTRGIAVMDQGLRRLVAAVDADPYYRDDTVFVVTPDCGRDDNPRLAVPFQHHFGDRSSHEVFAVVFGAGVPAGQVVDRPTQQIDVAPTVAALMGFDLPDAAGAVLEEVWG